MGAFFFRKQFGRQRQSGVITSKQYDLLRKTIRSLSAKPREAAGSTSQRAFSFGK
jgi:hypothetical protein